MNDRVIFCEGCGKAMRVSGDDAGRAVTCPSCGNATTLPPGDAPRPPLTEEELRWAPPELRAGADRPPPDVPPASPPPGVAAPPPGVPEPAPPSIGADREGPFAPGTVPVTGPSGPTSSPVPTFGPGGRFAPEPGLPPVPYRRPPGNGLAIASLVLGILGIAACLGPITGIPAIVCGILAIRRDQPTGLAVGGLVTGTLATLGFLLLLALGLLPFLLAADLPA